MVLTSTQSLVSQQLACDVLGLNRNTLRRLSAEYAFCGPKPPRRSSAGVQPRALALSEQNAVLEVLTYDEYIDQPPVQVY